MAKSRPSVQKRNKERNRIEKQLNKKHRRALRDAAKEDSDMDVGGDPDLAGIVAGPQTNEFQPDPLDRIDYDDLV